MKLLYNQTDNSAVIVANELFHLGAQVQFHAMLAAGFRQGTRNAAACVIELAIMKIGLAIRRNW